jgi:VPDSG-CTERM motif
VDKQFISNIDPSFTLNNTFRPTIEQDGIFYLAAIPGPGIHGSSNGYDTISQTGLLASAFTQYNFATGTFGSAHPNFAGDPLLLGLTQILQINYATNVTFEADYDNLRLAVNGVPDSGSTILLLLGSVTTLLVLRRMLPQIAG